MTDLTYTYLTHTKDAPLEVRLENKVGYLIRDYKVFHHRVNKYQEWLEIGIRQLRNYSEAVKFGRAITGESIVKFRQQMKRYKDNVQGGLFK